MDCPLTNSVPTALTRSPVYPTETLPECLGRRSSGSPLGNSFFPPIPPSSVTSVRRKVYVPVPRQPLTGLRTITPSTPLVFAARRFFEPVPQLSKAIQVFHP